MNTELSEPSSLPLEARARVFAALGDATRLQIVDLLRSSDLSPDRIAASLGITGNLLAHHLKILQEVGIIDRTESGNDRRRTYVHLRTDALSDLASDPVMLRAPRVVFVCTHNSARSILAQAAWNKSSDVPATSAGTHPTALIHARARSAASRAGLIIDQKTPQALDDVLRPDDVVVSVCDAVNEHLPTLDQPHFHWSIPDPSLRDTDKAFDAALNEISRRVVELAPHIAFKRPSRRAS